MSADNTLERADEAALADRELAAIAADPDEEAKTREHVEKAKADSAALRELLAERAGLEANLVAVFSNSTHLRELACRHPDRLARVLSSSPEATLERLLEEVKAPAEDEETLRARLRRARQEVALAVALADIFGVRELGEVTAALTAFADAAVGASVRWLLTHGPGSALEIEDPGDPEAGSGLVLLAMGKYGAGELNYSSDIDLIVFYDPRAARLREGADIDKYWSRFARNLSRILQERTPDGYVFRVDLRLRPDPGATPLAVRADTAVHYYRTRGRSWERAAFIKARQVAGDQAAGRVLLRALRPFVWRRRFDFSTVDDVEEIKKQIDVVRGHGEITVPGHNVKLGRGGIREIEFVVQTAQLIAGGRDETLRGRETLAMLDALVKAGWMERETAERLDAAYVFLRDVEHRLQMIADEQTHTLPMRTEDRARVARLLGFADVAAFDEAVKRVLEDVRREYVAFFTPRKMDAAGRLATEGADILAGDEAAKSALAAAGYTNPDAVIRTVGGWMAGRYAATRSPRSQALLTELLPLVLDALAETDNADAALTAFDLFLSQLPAGVQLFSLLKSHPELLGLLAVIMGASPRLARILTRRTRVLDVLLDPEFFGTLPDKEALKALALDAVRDSEAYEEILDRLRVFGQEQRFLVSVRVLTGSMSPYDAGVGYSRIADVLVRRALAAAREMFEARHGVVPGGEIAVLALGKLGGREMTATSDLDLILLYDHDPDAKASDGDKPLPPSQYYARLTQRLVAALSAPTAEGTLYEVDFRLRPSGHSGPLATRIDSFESYQESEAWTWEHMALTRARVVAGDEGLSQRAGEIVRKVLARPRDPETLRADIRDMRARLEQEKPGTSPWHIKTIPGGLIDLEFIAQFLQLANAAQAPDILSTNTRRAFDAAREAGLLEAADHELLRNTATLYQSLTQILSLALDTDFDPETAPGGLRRLLRRAADAPDFSHLEADLAQTQLSVRRRFDKLI